MANRFDMKQFKPMQDEIKKLRKQNKKMLAFIKRCGRCEMEYPSCKEEPGSGGCLTKILLTELEEGK